MRVSVALGVAALRLLGLLLLGLAATTCRADAQSPFDDPAAVTLEDYLPATHLAAGWDEAVPRPAAVLGHEIGARHARHDLLVAWFRRMAMASDRVKLHQIGHTWEGRPQLTAVITSAQNHARLEQLREAHLAGSDDAPVVVWLGYSIHGNEASGTQAAMVVAWHLAASRSTNVRQLLDRMIILLDPSLNPDGYGRFSNWANQGTGQTLVSEPEHRIREEPWPGGRTNHYFFDLNRDWLLLQQPESRNRVTFLREWAPNVLTDHHEMGADGTFFFQPGVPARKHPLIPALNVEITAALAEFHAAALNAAGRAYFDEEGYDDFYPGKGSTWPDLQGAVGILFEQASTRGLARDTANGLLTLPMALHNQVLASFSTLQGALAQRDRLNAFRRAYLAGELRPADLPAAWLIDPGPDADRAAALIDLLERQDLPLRRLGRTLTVDGDTWSADRSVVVPMDGPHAALAQAMFEERRTFEDSTFYDVSGWSLQHAFGARAVALDRLPALGADYRLGEPASGLAGATAAAAWVLPWDRAHAARVLMRLHRAGVRVRVAVAPFSVLVNGQLGHFDAGSVIVLRRDLLAALSPADEPLERLRAWAGNDGVFIGTDTLLTAEGPDLGSRQQVHVLEAVRPLLLAGDGVRGYSAGSLWHALDARLGVPTTLASPARLDRALLERHTHLILPDGGYGSLDKSDQGLIEAWVRNGGTLIAIRRAVDMIQKAGLLPQPQALSPEPAASLPWAEMRARDGAQQLGGAVLGVDLDASHPLAWGLGTDRIGLLRRGRHVLEAPTDDPFTVVGRYRQEPVVAGYVPAAAMAEIAAAPALLAVPVGQGAVIAFADAPAFRSVWHVGERLLFNALAFSNVLRKPSGRYGPPKADTP